jgi:hypothetical protein
MALHEEALSVICENAGRPIFSIGTIDLARARYSLVFSHGIIDAHRYYDIPMKVKVRN